MKDTVTVEYNKNKHRWLKIGRNKMYVISLSDDEVLILKSVLHKKTTNRIIKYVCQILLDLDEAHGKAFTQQQCVKSISVCYATIYNVIEYYSMVVSTR